MPVGVGGDIDQVRKSHFPGRARGDFTDRVTPDGPFIAKDGHLWITSSASGLMHRIRVPRPCSTVDVTFADIIEERKDWRSMPAARYTVEGGRVELYCRSIDVRLLRDVLRGN